MLQSIREKFSGWILIIIMLLLVVPFALFGINNYFQAQIDTFVAKVNDAEIAPQQLQERLDLQRRQMRQTLGQEYTMNGALYLFRWDYFKQHQWIYQDREGVYGHVMDRFHSVEIDEPVDLAWAEFLVAGGYVPLAPWRD